MQAQLKGLKKELATVEKEEKEFQEKEAELERYEKEHPNWDVDNISNDSTFGDYFMNVRLMFAFFCPTLRLNNARKLVLFLQDYRSVN